MSESPVVSAHGLEATANPFPGLRSFEFEESHLFFGRDGQSEQLITKLGRKRFLAVVGTSGSGKSSLVRAGLLPALLGGFMPGAGSEWRIAVMRPGNDPIGNLARALDVVAPPASSNGSSDIHAAGLEAALRRGSRGLVDVFPYLSGAANDNLLVVVDQFEEIFRMAKVSADQVYQNEAAAFVKLFLEASRQREVPIYVVLTMRSDYLGDCAQFWGLPEAVNESQYLIPRLTRDQQREAIGGPVAVGGSAITPRLVNRLLNDVGDNQDQLPILQHALMRSWNKWREMGEQGPLDLREYDAIGGMANALSLHADEAFGELPDDASRQATEKLFKALTEKGPDNREIRRPITLAEACTVTGATESEIKHVVEIFRRPGRSFLMPPADVPLHSESLLDISHESLIRCWQRLKGWVDEEGESARIYRRLAQTAELYQKGQAGLWGDPDLQLALDWRDRNKPNESWARRYHPDFAGAMAFLDRSRQHRDQEAVATQKHQRKMRLMTLGLFVVSLLALLVPAYLTLRVRKVQEAADQDRKKAQALLDDANRRVQKADENTQAANQEIAKKQEQVIQEQTQAETNRKGALALRIAALASDEFKRGDLKMSGALAIESLKASDTFQGRRSLEDVLRITPAPPEIIRKGPGSAIDAVAYSGDSKWIAWAARDNQVVLSDLLNPKNDFRLRTDNSGVMSLAFSQDGKLLAAGLPGALWLWDVATGKPVQEPIRNIGNPHVVVFSPDGKYLATLGANQLWLFQKNSGQWKGSQVPATRDLPTMEGIAFLGDGSLAIAGNHTISFMDVPSLKLRTDTQNDGQCNAVSVSSDSRWLAAGCSSQILIADMTAQSPDLDPRVPRPLLFYQTIPIENAHVDQIAVGNNGKYVAIKDQNSPEIHVYEVATKEESFRTTRPLAVGMPTRAFNFPPDGKVLLTGLQDGSVVAWNLARGAQALRWPYHGIVSGLTFSPDKKWLAAVTFDDNAGKDGSVRILNSSDVENFKPVQTFHIGQDLRKPFFSPDGHFLGVFDSKALHLIQANPWKRLAHDIPGEFSLAAFSPNGRVLVTQGSDGIRRFDTATWQELKPISGNFRPGFSFSPDSQWLAISAEPIAHVLVSSFQVWHLTGTEAAWTERRTLHQPQARPPDGGPQQLIKEAKDWPAVNPETPLHSPDGRWVAGTGESEVELFAADSDIVGVLKHDDKVLDTAFSPDGRWLLTSSMDKTVRLWPLAAKDLIDRACKLFPWNLNQEEWSKLKLEGPYHKTCPEAAGAH